MPSTYRKSRRTCWIAASLLAAAILHVEPAGRAQDGAVRDIKRTGTILDSEPSSHGDDGDRWAVIIGVEKHEDETIANVKYAQRDAELMARTLQEVGFDKERISLLHDGQPSEFQPYLDSFSKLHRVLTHREMKADDTVLVYVASHGVVLDGEGYLVPRDGIRGEFGSATLKPTSFPFNLLRSLLNRCKARNKVLILDCCHAGSFDEDERFRISESGGDNFYALLSCGQGQTSMGWDEVKQGLFTYFVTEGLKGRADQNSDGLVDAAELHRYVSNEVPRQAAKVENHRQNPYQVSGGQNFPLLAVVPSKFSAPGAGWDKRDWAKEGLGEAFTNSVGMELVPIPPDLFWMGSAEGKEGFANERPLHQVRITRPFYIGAHEVTQGQYTAVMGSRNPSYWRLNNFSNSSRTRVPDDSSRYPVERVSWREAVAFCNTLSALEAEQSSRRRYRLPTEAEWEYAARAGTTTAYTYGDILDSSQANVRNQLGKPVDVGTSGPQNAAGMYDVHGNVAEWCSDWYNATYYDRSPAADPQGERTPGKFYKVIRGGHYASDALMCRSAVRYYADDRQRLSHTGFRVVCEVTAAD